MKLTMSSSDDLKTIMSLVANITEEAIFKASPEGITFRGMDPSHVALVDISIPNSAFDTFDCIAETTFGVRVDEFSKLLKRADKKNVIELSVDDGLLTLKIGDKKKFNLRLLNTTTGDTPVPKINLPNSFSIENTNFDNIIADVLAVSDYLTIRVSGGDVEFLGKGDSSDVVVRNQDLDEVNVEEDGEGHYSLEYLSPAVKALSSSGGKISISMAQNKPLQFEFKIGSVGRIIFFLAPRVLS
jgi:proliferating cell nuclear antigen